MEWEALDCIRGVDLTKSNALEFNLPKLKGNRGNTMITLYESERLIQLIRTANSRKTLRGNKFTFNCENQLIEPSSHKHSYTEKQIIA